MEYRKIAVRGKEEKGQQLAYFNSGRETKLSIADLRSATMVDTPELRALLQFLGDDAELGTCMPTLVKETKQGWQPLTTAPRRGENRAALAGTGDPQTRWYLSWPGRPNPITIEHSSTLQERLAFQEAKRPGPDARFSTSRMTLACAQAEFAARRAHTRDEHVTASTPPAEALSPSQPGGRRGRAWSSRGSFSAARS